MAESNLKHIIPITGSSADNDAYLGIQGEITVDTTNNTIRLHDGVTMGGHSLWSSKTYIPTKLSELVNDTNYITRVDTVNYAVAAERDSKGTIICDGYLSRSGGSLLGEASSYTLGTTSLNFVNTNDTVYVSLGNNGYEFKIPSSGSASYNGTITANAVYNATWNDYAEFFERGEQTEVGDIIAVDLGSETEQYVKASLDNQIVVGVHSDTFGHLIGGDQPPEGEDFVQYNMPKFIPVGLKGRVYVKVNGPVSKGEVVRVSEVPGVGTTSGSASIVGYAVETKSSEGVGLVKVLLKV